MGLAFPIAPMLATRADAIPEGDEWAFEIKWDGYRAIAFIDRGRLRLQSRSGLDITADYPELGALADHTNAGSAIIDGEIVAITESGAPSFAGLQRRSLPVAFYAFDVLRIDGSDTVALAYADRRRLLMQLVESGPHHLAPSHHVGGGRELAAETRERGLEGLVAKRLDSAYSVGQRSRSWLKIKHRRRAEVVVGGFTPGEGGRRATFGALLVGVEQGDALRFAGGVGSGFTEGDLHDLAGLLTDLASDVCPFAPPPPTKVIGQATWVTPRVRITVDFSELTDDGILRHASFIDTVDAPIDNRTHRDRADNFKPEAPPNA